MALQLIITVVFAVVAFVVACVRLATAMEPSGLFVKGHPLTYALIAVLAVFGVITLVINLRTDKKSAIDTTKEIQPHNFSKVMSFVMLACCVLAAASIIASLMGQRFLIQNFLMIVLPLVTAFSFLPMAVFFSTGKIKGSVPAAALVPVYTTAAMLVVNYVSTTQMSTPAQYGFLIIAQLVNVLFFYYFAKFLTGAACVRHTLITSSFAVVINAAAYIAPFVYDIFSGSLAILRLSDLIGAATCIYALSVFLFIRREKGKNNI